MSTDEQVTTGHDTVEPDTGGRTSTLDIVGLVARLVLGGIFVVAGLLKVGTLEGSAAAVRAYQVLPFEFAGYLGYALPIIEIMIGVLLILGLFTRVSAILLSFMLVAFIIGIVQAWARGLTIDCGCFGGGGQVEAGQTEYPQRIAEDVAMLAGALWLSVRPRSLFSLDRRLLGRD